MTSKTSADETFDYPELDKMDISEFQQTYKYFILSTARQLGMDDYQANVVLNDVLIAIYVKKSCHYDARQGKFSHYLSRTVRNMWRSMLRERKRYVDFSEEDLARFCDRSAIAEDTIASSRILDWIREGIRILRTEVRAQQVVDVYLMTLIGKERPMDIEKRLHLRPGYASVAKNRCRPRLAAILNRIKERMLD